MGVLTITAETFEIPKWMIDYPELDVQLNNIQTPVFEIWYGVESRGALDLHHKTFQLPFIPGCRGCTDNAHQVVTERKDLIAKYIINKLKSIYGIKPFRFIDHVYFG